MLRSSNWIPECCHALLRIPRPLSLAPPPSLHARAASSPLTKPTLGIFLPLLRVKWVGRDIVDNLCEIAKLIGKDETSAMGGPWFFFISRD